MHLPSDGTIFTPKSATLADLLPKVHGRELALPDFQRPWVWQPEMIKELIISVAYRYPAGSLLTMPVPSGNTFALRPFEGSGDKLSQGEKPNLMVLDGQQRLTSLYQALYRHDGVVIGRGTKKQETYFFYLNVPHLLSDPDGDIETGEPYFEGALFYVRVEKNGHKVRYDRITPLYELNTPEQELENGALPLSYVFNHEALGKWKDEYFDRVLPDGPEYKTASKELSKKWDKLVSSWLHNIRGYHFPVVELNEKMQLHAICHIFEKVNSTGVPLDVFDLCTAKLWAEGFELNKKWHELWTKELKPLLPMQPLWGTNFLQALSLLETIERKRKNPEGKLAVSCRKDALLDLDRDTVEQWWPVLIEGYKEASKFMFNQGIMAERILPYSTMIVPLSAILADLKRSKGSAHLGAAYAKISRWYWCSVFSQRYGSQVETVAAQDFEQVINWVTGDGPEPDAVRMFSFRSDSLLEITTVRNAIYKGILCLLVGKGAEDFGGKGRLATDLFYNSVQDHHHIFPKAALEKKGINKEKDPRLNSIANMALIDGPVNRSIGGDMPSVYVKKLRTSLSQPKFDTILASHCISPEALTSDDWEHFLYDRRERLRKLIEETCGGGTQPFSSISLAELVIEDEDETMTYQMPA